VPPVNQGFVIRPFHKAFNRKGRKGRKVGEPVLNFFGYVRVDEGVWEKKAFNRKVRKVGKSGPPRDTKLEDLNC